MERRQRTSARPAKGRLNTAGPARIEGLHLPHIEAFLEEGEITLGLMSPVGYVAIAADSSNALAMLKRRFGESLPDLLLRLDAAIAYALKEGDFIDEITPP
ncbi:hypothetical protein ETQ85_24945 [Zoogloea oleivorans]|uniref:Uncharacterized protein n=1 Tax=Zoogloea oleivorans TaxID=1552750 RepID=A0A6C2C9N3_9RHOO|nr:hypothetical protein [Zoogloea oleivorans]TYC50781.1 hypothetical protein ETQ85_24945 [Zoogloea oleivorans]